MHISGISQARQICLPAMLPTESPLARPSVKRPAAAEVFTWALVAPAAIWAIARLFGLERGYPFVQLIAFTQYVAVASLIPLAVTLLRRHWWAAGVAGLAFVTLALCVLPRGFGSPSTMDGVPVTVMSMNMRVGGADAPTIVAAVRSHHADVLTLQELTPRAVANLRRAGLTDVLPYSEVHAKFDVGGSGVFARFPLTNGGVKDNPGFFQQARATLNVPGAVPVIVESVHPVAPAEIDSIPLWTGGLRDETPAGGATRRILAGDFNATLDHVELRRILGTGYRDAAAEVGAGFEPTWPYFGPRDAVTPKVTIDHVLVDRGIGVRDFTTVAVPLTDHRAIVATLILPRTART
jgi:endonuclease/exonuclease/phosphatase family metal-dependent hydrolase